MQYLNVTRHSGTWRCEDTDRRAQKYFTRDDAVQDVLQRQDDNPKQKRQLRQRACRVTVIWSYCS